MANSSNNTWCMSLTKPVYYYGHLIPSIVLFIFGLTFNSIALYYFARSRHFRRSAYSYYFSAIAVFDLIRLTIWSLFLLLDYVIFKLHLHPYECSIQAFSEAVTASISAWLTVSLTVERCLAIYNPFGTFKDTRYKRAIIVIISVILASCAVNSLFLLPGYFEIREYIPEIRVIICAYRESPTKNLTENTHYVILAPKLKRIYQTIFIIIVRVFIPFMLLLSANIILFESIRRSRKQLRNLEGVLYRPGNQRQITPMILFSSCILLLTVSPRYLLQQCINFFEESLHCSFIHLAPHLLKTLELCNYSFNVFISIVSGKQGRNELTNMLLRRSNGSANFNSSLLHHSSASPRVRHQRHMDNKKNLNQTHLLLNNCNHH